MKWYINLKTSVKLISAFIIVAILTGFTGFYGLSGIQAANNRLDQMYLNNLLSVQYLSQATIDYQRIRVAIRDVAIFTNADDRNKRIDDLKGMYASVEDTIDKYRGLNLSKDTQAKVQKFDSTWSAYKKLVDSGVKLVQEGKDAEYVTVLTGDIASTGNDLKAILDDQISSNVQQAEQAKKDSEAAYLHSKVITISIIIAVVILSIVFGIVIAQIISRPLNKIVSVITKVAEGDLRVKSEVDSKDEIGLLSKSLNHMVDNLQTVVGGIIQSSQSVAAASEQISASTQEIASGSTNQARAAGTITELFKELSAAINSAATSAEQAAELSGTTVQTARAGGNVVDVSVSGMQKVNATMSRLEDDSLKIGNIIEVIDDIAEQTNLLALNAAIEAARAGDQGRGFAVVADEVRKLAERSSAATKEITAIIKVMQDNTKQSVVAVMDSVDQSTKTGDAFSEIIDMVNQSSIKVNEIAAACEEEAAQATEVMQSVESIAAASEEAAAAAEETAATCQSLAQLADDLQRAVARFKI